MHGEALGWLAALACVDFLPKMAIGDSNKLIAAK
jgi:hypothetical protein